MKHLSSSFAAVLIGWTAMTAPGCGAAHEGGGVVLDDGDTLQAGAGSAVALDEIGVVEQALVNPCPRSECQIDPDGRAFCAQTNVASVSNRNVFYRIGDNTGPGYDATTGRHAAVMLFQGTSKASPDDGVGGNNGPGATWCVARTKPGEFAVWHQIATVVALVKAGYTVMQPAAHIQFGPFGANRGYFWDTNTGTDAVWRASADKTLMDTLVTQLQPTATTFGAIDINHVYAMGISSGGYMSSRIANEYAGGLNNDSTVRSTTKPFRAVAIESGSYQSCFGNFAEGRFRDRCVDKIAAATIPATHAPTFFLHDMKDQVVPYNTMDAYRNKLNAMFPPPGLNPAYTVNGVREEFTRLRVFDFMAQPEPGHQWDECLGADAPLCVDSNGTPLPTNAILQWFNSHR
jgi:hypothetical protein